MSKGTVLVVDDIPGTRKIVCEMMIELGFSQVVEAADGGEAYAKAQADPPQIIISDFMMTPKTGMDLLRLVKADPKLNQIPFFLVSSVTEKEVSETALELGANGYIPRPVSFQALKESVQAVCEPS